MPIYDAVAQFDTAAAGTVDVSVHINHNEAWHVLARDGWQRTGTERGNRVEWSRSLESSTDRTVVSSTIAAFQRLYANVAYPGALSPVDGAIAREAIGIARRGQAPAASSTARFVDDVDATHLARRTIHREERTMTTTRSDSLIERRFDELLDPTLVTIRELDVMLDLVDGSDDA